ncbi:1,4-dihydroxy-2-naphthoate octaprenyltransferase [Candidatus Aerophobetes bacterium]|uniref:1,4-dihydroxy-2-naphthoate octaprenyltransferase n=1 Tax=Aerophobetes bacterium TaxID=2030807 RepID=A0A523QLS3_UNCAE|nr:MAG: 1,4-dihydroxy-2-naphthoate octaprenyltransferase [Candidatus Aerophobetes bacterium]
MERFRFKVWIRAMRAPFFQAVMVPSLLGTAIVWYRRGTFYWEYFLLATLAVIFINAGTNLNNDYFDHQSRSDDINREPTPFSGGSRVIQENLISPAKIYHTSLIFFGLAALIGLYLTFVRGPVVLVIGILGVLSGYFYTASPIRIGYRGWGEFVVGLNCGPLVVAGAYYVQAQTLSLEAVFISIPVGLLIAAVLYINEFPDYACDKGAGKDTLIVKVGRERARKGFYSLLIGSYLFIILGILLRIVPWTVIVSLFTFPLAWKAMKIAHSNYVNTQRLIPAMSSTVTIHLTVGLLLSFGYVTARILTWI